MKARFGARVVIIGYVAEIALWVLKARFIFGKW